MCQEAPRLWRGASVFKPKDPSHQPRGNDPITGSTRSGGVCESGVHAFFAVGSGNAGIGWSGLFHGDTYTAHGGR